jgi:hypothetical protein
MLFTEISKEIGTENAIGIISIIGIWIFDLRHSICTFSLCHKIDAAQEG